MFTKQAPNSSESHCAFPTESIHMKKSATPSSSTFLMGLKSRFSVHLIQPLRCSPSALHQALTDISGYCFVISLDVAHSLIF